MLTGDGNLKVNNFLQIFHVSINNLGIYHIYQLQRAQLVKREIKLTI